jgi:hypothetical protein
MSTLPHDVYDRSLKRFWDLDPRPLLKLAFGAEDWTLVETRAVEVVHTLKQVADRLAYVEGSDGPFFAHAAKPSTTFAIGRSDCTKYQRRYWPPPQSLPR